MCLFCFHFFPFPLFLTSKTQKDQRAHIKNIPDFTLGVACWCPSQIAQENQIFSRNCQQGWTSFIASWVSFLDGGESHCYHIHRSPEYTKHIMPETLVSELYFFTLWWTEVLTPAEVQIFLEEVLNLFPHFVVNIVQEMIRREMVLKGRKVAWLESKYNCCIKNSAFPWTEFSEQPPSFFSISRFEALLQDALSEHSVQGWPLFSISALCLLSLSSFKNTVCLCYFSVYLLVYLYHWRKFFENWDPTSPVPHCFPRAKLCAWHRYTYLMHLTRQMNKWMNT